MSPPVQVKQGVAYTDSVVYQLPSGSFQTGKVQANFTIRLSKTGVGNQALTGITLTEVDSVNNPGDYALAFATNSFLSAVGEYELVIFDTASPFYSWEQVYQVTALGQPGSLAPVFFQAAVGNARAIDSSSVAIAGATVYVKRGNSFIYTLTTDASGLFIFYADPGTYTLYYEKSGYALANTTVTFTTTTSTGPLTDIVMATASNPSTVVYSSLAAYARQQSYDETGTQADSRILRAVNNAVDMVARDTMSNWWLRKNFLAFYGSQSFTCTVTKGSATVTSTSGNFPTWANIAKLKIGSQVVDISANPTSATLTLATTFNGATNSYACVLFLDAYALPTNCYQFGRILPGQNWGWGGEPVSAERLWEAQNASTFGQVYPSAFAVAYSKLLVYPYPTTDNTVAYTYHARPTPMVSSNDVGDFDPSQIGLIYHAINHQIAIEFGKALSGTPEDTLKLYHDELGRAVNTDRLPADLPSLSRGGFPSARDLPMWKSYRSP
jgi:hypothetical protein